MFSKEFWNQVEKDIEAGYINVQKHPTEDLYIYNYSNSAQFDNYWTETTMVCRGLIVDGNKNIVGFPIRKFFSPDQAQGEKLNLKIPWGKERYKLYEKMDGSFILSYRLSNGLLRLASRGSFVSDQSIEANKILVEKYLDYNFNPDWTYIFEVLYPQNRIVVDYGDMRDLVLLAIIETKTGMELSLPSQEIVPFPVVKQIPFPTEFKNYRGIDFIGEHLLEEYQNKSGTEFEGIVVRFDSGFRLKLKTENYKLLHKIFTGLSERRIWEIISEGGSLKEILDVCPDEFHKYAKQVEIDLRMSFGATEGVARLFYESGVEYADNNAKCTGDFELDQKLHRKNFAEYILKCDNFVLKSVAFCMYGNQKYDAIIWKSLSPSGSKTFKNIGDVE